jgi:TonB-linked SusC/RagA family outer membrane protein
MKTKLNGIITLLLALVVQVAFAQQTVTGKVTDTDGGLLGAVVSVKGGNVNATTDFDGNYTILVNAENTLVFSYTGYDSVEIVVGTQTVINTVLTTTLSEVVIIGYRDAVKEKTNVAVSVVTSETIENRPNASFVQTLSGQVAGLNIFTNSGQPGANSTVNLRGVGSINGNTEPLFLIDGIPVDEDNFRSLNPQDIASVTVLKDAAGTSIYGNRGANGVIVIETKKGSFDQPLKIDVTSIQSFTTLMGNDYNYMNSSQLLRLERERGVGVGSNGFDGSGTPLTDAQIAAAPNTDWKKEFFRTGISTNNTVTLSSGGKNSKQLTSIGYFDQEGVLVQSDLKRFNIRSNVSGRSENKRFTYGLNLNANYSTSDEPNSIGSGAINRNYVLGAFISVPYLQASDYTNARDLVASTGTLEQIFRSTPLILLDRLNSYQRTEEEIKLLGSMNLGYKLSDNLTLRNVSGFDYQNVILTRSQGSDNWSSIYFENANNPGQNGFGFQQTSRQFTFNSVTSLSFNKTFNEKHTLDVALYTEYFKAHFKGFGFRANGLDSRLFSPGDGAGFISDNGNSDVFVDTINATVLNSGLFSYFGSLDYDYDSKYGFSATLRRDASSRFAGTNRWGTFYSLAGRWNVSNEDFWGEGNLVNTLKLRASYGTVGNQNVSGGGYFSGLQLTQDTFGAVGGYGGVQAIGPGVFGISDLRWETTRQTNFGVDFEALDSRLRANVDLYYKDTEDLFQSRNISGTAGTGGFAQQGNFGTLTNKGIDLDIRYKLFQPKRAGDFGLEIGVVGNYNESIIRDLPTEDGQSIGIGREGGRLGEYYQIRYAGVNPANGELLHYDVNGDLTENPNDDTDRVWMNKNLTPDLQGGITLNADFKGFFLTTQWNYATGIDRFDFNQADVVDITNLRQFNVSSELLNAWTPDNRVTDVPSLDATNVLALDNSARWLREADYLRLRFVSLGYNFDKTTVEKFYLSRLRIFVNAENLVTFSKWKGFDAAVLSNGSRQYPTPRIISVGLEIGI